MGTWSDTVNMVNAPYLAKERGLAVREIRNEGEGDYHTLVAVTVGTENGPKRVEGTLFGNRAPRLVRIFDIQVEAELAARTTVVAIAGDVTDPAHPFVRSRAASTTSCLKKLCGSVWR
jgi:hypothetical protein